MKFQSELESLCAAFIGAGGNTEIASSMLQTAAGDLMGISVLARVQNEFASVLAWLVQEVEGLKEREGKDVSTDTGNQGEASHQREPEGGEKRSPAIHLRVAREGD